MRAYCLASSSSGNCYVLEFDINGVPTRIMVECGIPIKTIYQSLAQNNIDITTISACLITHAHGDHCKAAKDLERICIPIFATKETLTKIDVLGEELVDLQPKRVCKGLFAMPFQVEHDIEGACGFIIKTKTECVLFVNDHKRWTADLRDFKPNYVFIECNYDHKVVYAQLNELRKLPNPTVEEQQKMRQHERNLNSHCSLNGTLKGLRKLNLKNCSTIFLMHLSDRYANEYRMKIEVQKETGILTYACKKGGGIK